MTAANIFTDPAIQQTAEQNARRLGLSLRAYLSRLVLNDTITKRKKIKVFPVEYGWGPVPKPVQESWAREEEEALKHGPTAHSVAEFRRQLEAHETD